MQGAAQVTDQSFNDIDPNDRRVQIALLAMRLDNLGREKEKLERDLDEERSAREEHERAIEARIAAMEKSFQRGAGIVMVLPIVGTIIGLLLAYGKTIFAPWTGGK